MLVLAALLRYRPGGRPAGMWGADHDRLLDSGATELFAIATTKGLLSVVAVLAALYPVLVAILARSCSTAADAGAARGRVAAVAGQRR